MKTKQVYSRSSWETNGDYDEYMNILLHDKTAKDDEIENMFKRHVLLEFLACLSVLEYDRGYDGHYYDIRIKQRGK